VALRYGFLEDFQDLAGVHRRNPHHASYVASRRARLGTRPVFDRLESKSMHNAIGMERTVFARFVRSRFPGYADGENQVRSSHARGDPQLNFRQLDLGHFPSGHVGRFVTRSFLASRPISSAVQAPALIGKHQVDDGRTRPAHSSLLSTYQPGRSIPVGHMCLGRQARAHREHPTTRHGHAYTNHVAARIPFTG
jgi:hypothetical protein